jgi:tetratricopeptide (TPR) repeat protein/2-polyprenyl-3-methyl-5-hydroxy-6-metoxy-1,4-benzoquinol methylase
MSHSRAAPFAQALAHLQAGRLAEAEQFCRQILSIQPRNAEALHLLGLVARKAGQNAAAADLMHQAIGLNPGVAAFHFNLGHVLLDEHKPEDAAACFRQAIALKPDHVRAHFSLGQALQALNRLDEASSCFRSVLALKPDNAEAHNNLGNIASRRSDAEEAIACFRRALALQPDFAVAHYNLGNVLAQQGALDEAAASYQRALSPDFAEAHFALARLRKQQGRLAEAEAGFRRGLAVKPDRPTERGELASILLAQGELGQAFMEVRQSLLLGESNIARHVFVNCARQAQWNGEAGEWQPLLLRALTEPWAHPSDLAQSCAGFLKHDAKLGPMIARANAAWPQSLPADLPFGAANPLLEALLCLTPNADVEMERFLTLARRQLLEMALADAQAPDAALNFAGALARQCFINEYVFAAADDEAAKVQRLQASVTDLLNAGAPVPALSLLALAAHVPLHALSQAQRLLERDWPPAVQAVLTQQIAQPGEEEKLRATIQRLTAIEDETSRRVRDQYDENPYPRWVKTAPVEPADGLTQYLHRKFPLTVPAAGTGGPFDILVAGCGTGKHPIETAHGFPQARILAIDLSRSSLAYASFKTREMGLTSIEYAQADILALDGLPRRFALIESIGVLHHLGDVFAGWRTLLSLLAPGGFMRLALYSQTARRNIAKARAFVADRNYGNSAEDIRRARQEIAAWDDRAAAEAILNSPDFYSVSNCRDLIFHTQEHGMTIPGIAQFLRENGLTFLGFDLNGDVLEAYRRRFPHDAAATNLDQWERFEADNPTIFAGMYHFWVLSA